MARSLENTESIERRLKRNAYSCELQRFCAVMGNVPTDSRLQSIDALCVFFRSDGGLNTVFPGVLDAVHGLVGGLHQLVRRGRHVGQRRNADRHGEMDVEAVA